MTPHPSRVYNGEAKSDLAGLESPRSWPNLMRGCDMSDSTPKTKRCIRCGEVKPVTLFSVDNSRSRDGWQRWCKQCSAENYAENKERRALQAAENHLANREQINARHRAHYAENREEYRARWREYYAANKDAIAARSSAYGIANREACTARSRAWIDANREKHNARVAEYNRRRMATDPRFRLDRVMKSAVSEALAGKKAGRPWESLVGYTVDDLMAHLESQFSDGMTWENRSEWHIDHIVPKSWFDYESPDDPAFLMAWSLENLQPLWATDNQRKGNRRAG